MVLTLSVPVSVRSLPKEIETEPIKARAWAASLPITRAVEAARTLAETVETLNRGKLNADDRLALLDAYRPTRDVLLDELESSYAYAALPLQAKPREAFDIARRLLVEFGYGYKMYVLEKTGKFIVFNARKTLPRPMFRAMQDVYNLMLQCYKTYHSVSAGLWQEAHTLYAYAAEQGFADDVIDADASISELHTQMMMLSLAHPERLMHHEVDRVIAILKKKRGLVRVTAIPADAAHDAALVITERVFLVALDSDSPPKVSVQGVRAPAGDAVRKIDTAALIAAMRDEVKSTLTRTSSAHSRATHDLDDLMTRLIRLWSDPPRRQLTRNLVATTVAICSGITALAYFSELSIGEPDDAPPIPSDPMSQLIGVESWSVINQSANGLRLHRTLGGNVGVTVGDIVGIRFAHSRTWNVGAVRWLTSLASNEIEFGVELIAPAAANVLVVSATAGQSTLPGLLVATHAGESTSDTLLASPGTFVEGSEFVIVDQGQTFSVRALRLIESTSRFDLFVFEPV
jgi:hypothetical protein